MYHLELVQLLLPKKEAKGNRHWRRGDESISRLTEDFLKHEN